MNTHQLVALCLAVLLAHTAAAQVSVRGRVVNERGQAVEYVSIGFENDSVSTISDAQGRFAIDIPAGRTNELSFTHVSYQPHVVPFVTYAAAEELTVTLRDKVVALTEVVVGKKNRPQTVAGKNIGGPVTSFRGQGKANGIEWGPVFKSKRNYAVSDLLLTIRASSYQWCVLSFNIYEVRGGRFVNILNKPLYHRLEKTSTKTLLDIRPEETIVLRAKRKYYVSIAVVDSDHRGILDMQSQLKTSYARSLTKGKKRKLPIGPAIVVKGYEVE